MKIEKVLAWFMPFVCTVAAIALYIRNQDAMNMVRSIYLGMIVIVTWAWWIMTHDLQPYSKWLYFTSVPTTVMVLSWYLPISIYWDVLWAPLVSGFVYLSIRDEGLIAMAVLGVFPILCYGL